MTGFSHHRRRIRHRSTAAARIETCEERILLAAPTVVDPNLAVRPVAEGLNSPVSIAFLGHNDFLVIEKNSGQVKRVLGGEVQSTPVLDLPVNWALEQGLLGIAAHPRFAANPYVYLYWTESTTGQDSGVLSETPLLGNRVDRFVWDGATLTYDRTLVRLRAAQPPNLPHETVAFGGHVGGVIRFGPDGKLYIFIGDTGRRGQMQNLAEGPLGPGQPDDQFGGPEPGDPHLTGVVLRLNDDGSTPTDNPFFDAGAEIGGEVGENVQKIYAYGFRNAIGMAFDPMGAGSGNLWLAENADDAFTELNLVEPGMNGGWVQFMGPLSRIAEFRSIETGDFFGLQQERWSPENIATTAEEALDRLFMLPGAHYSDPEFSWRYEIAPGGIGFLGSRNLGPQYVGDMFVGAAIPRIEGGHIFRFSLMKGRRHLLPDDPRLNDRVADNHTKNDITESESLLFGRGFGTASDIQMGPNGNLYVVSLSQGAVYEIHHITRPGPIGLLGRVDRDLGPAGGGRFTARLSGGPSSIGSGSAEFDLSADGTELHYRVTVERLSDVLAAYLQFGPPGSSGVMAVLFDTPASLPVHGTLVEGTLTGNDLLPGVSMVRLLDELRLGNMHVSIRTQRLPLGELHGRIVRAADGGAGASLASLDSVFEDSSALLGALEIPLQS